MISPVFMIRSVPFYSSPWLPAEAAGHLVFGNGQSSCVTSQRADREREEGKRCIHGDKARADNEISRVSRWKGADIPDGDFLPAVRLVVDKEIYDFFSGTRSTCQRPSSRFEESSRANGMPIVPSRFHFHVRSQGTEFRKAIEFRKFVRPRRVYRDAKRRQRWWVASRWIRYYRWNAATRNSGTGENNAFEEACRATIYRERFTAYRIYLEAKEDRPPWKASISRTLLVGRPRII